MSVIEVRNLRKTYGDKVAVEDVSFTVEQGEIFGILGPNGAGKTTTVESIAGLRKPDGGTVSVLGLDPVRDRRRVTELVGVQLQESQLPEKVTVAEALDLYRSFYRNPADVGELVTDLGLTESLRRPFGTLSGGQKQRLSIALALLGDPRIAILDELTTGLDPQARRDTWSVIEKVRDRGVTVVLVSHFMEEAERLCDRLALIDHGTVAMIDTPAGLVARVEVEQRMRFRPVPSDGSAPIEDAELTALPEVTSVERHGDLLIVTGTEDVVMAVTSLLARRRIVAGQLRVDQTTLDDAFVALTRASTQGK